MKSPLRMLTGLLAMSAGTAIGADTTPGNASWHEFFPQRVTQIETHDKFTLHPYTDLSVTEAGASYTRTNGIETFRLFNHDASNRAEIVVQNKWITGFHEFEGDLRVSPPTDDESCVQIFGRQKKDTEGGPVAMIRHSKKQGGSLYLSCNGASPTLTNNIDGQWVHINLIHDDVQNTVTVYLNDQPAGTFNAPPGERHKTGGSYFKYGCYGSLKTPSAQVEWRNIHFYEK